MTWEYDVKTATFSRNGSAVLQASYAGAVGYKNDTSKECVLNNGPLPRGSYQIGEPHQAIHTGAYTLNLDPSSNNNMCGRSLFRIHGANGKHPLASSNGCIIAPLSVRKAIWMSGDRELIVK